DVKYEIKTETEEYYEDSLETDTKHGFAEPLRQIMIPVESEEMKCEMKTEVEEYLEIADQNYGKHKIVEPFHQVMVAMESEHKTRKGSTETQNVIDPIHIEGDNKPFKCIYEYILKKSRLYVKGKIIFLRFHKNQPAKLHASFISVNRQDEYVDMLELVIEEEIRAIPLNMYYNAMNDFPKRCQLCLDVNGEHVTASDTKPFTCEFCGKLFTKMSDLVIHRRIHTNEKPYTCEVCSKAFAHKSSFNCHRRLHTNEKPYSCHICKIIFSPSKSFANKCSLTIHNRTHTNEKLYTCNICLKSFIEKSTLTTHERIHTNERTFSCDICFKLFTRRAYVDIHMRSHTKEKPFVCDICSQTFSYKSSLVYHLRIIQREKQKLTRDTYRTISGANQLHSELTKVFPCGQQQKLFANDDPQDFHDAMHHKEECTGVEHFTTCNNPADPLMEVWSRRCSKRCPKLQESINKFWTCHYIHVGLVNKLKSLYICRAMIGGYNRIPEISHTFHKKIRKYYLFCPPHMNGFCNCVEVVTFHEMVLSCSSSFKSFKFFIIRNEFKFNLISSNKSS
ncbi:hypothetical protein L9F63_023635, partial [Diploptera punctata]